MDSKKPYTSGEVAGFCDVTINSVKKWIAAGKLSAFRTPGGHYRVNRDEFESFVGKYKLDVKERIFPVRRKVLIIDDERDIVEYIKAAIETMQIGCVVEIAYYVYDALIKVGDFKPELMILDLRMPRIDGFEVTKRIKGDAATKGIKILAVTAYGNEDVDKVLQCGADACLTKPLKLKEFQKNVQRLLK